MVPESQEHPQSLAAIPSTDSYRPNTPVLGISNTAELASPTSDAVLFD